MVAHAVDVHNNLCGERFRQYTFQKCDHDPACFSRLMRKLKHALLLIGLGLGLAATPASSSAEDIRPSDPVWHLLVEPSYMPHEAAWPIPGTRTTVLVP